MHTPRRRGRGSLSRRTGATVALVAALSTVVAGCGEPAGPRGTAEGGDVPTTPQALAFVAAEHVGEPRTAEELRWGWRNQYRDRRVLSVDLRYGTTGVYDGDTVSVSVGRRFSKDVSSCAGTDIRFAGCAELDGGGLLLWETEAPEEDPGLVHVAVPKGQAVVFVSYAGPVIDGDPREMDLPVGTDTLVALANDPRVDLTTSQAAVDGGERLTAWREPVVSDEE
ncbi:MAG TPA: hypothetical protein VFZ64_10735 [Nocardioidaceae bacterium]